MNIVQRILGGVSAGGIFTGLFRSTGAIFVPGSVVTGITAHAGGGQASATLLTGQFNSIDTVATAADSFALPAATYVGQEVEVVNNTANAAQAFGSGTDTINNTATATGVSHPAGKMAVYKAATIGTAAAWFRHLSA